VLARRRYASRQIRQAMMPDEMRQSSSPVSKSHVAGNCGKPCARPLTVQLTEQAGSDVPQHLRVPVACAMNVAADIRQIKERALAIDRPGKR